MPYLESSTRALPYQSDPTAREDNTSRDGARAIASHAGTLRRRYAELLASHPAGLTDEEAAGLLGVDRTTQIPRRHELGSAVVRCGRRMGRHGVGQRVYRLATDAMGRTA